MRFKPTTWFPIAVVLSAINVVAAGFAAQPGEPVHAATHAALAVAFGIWAHRLRQGIRGGDLHTRVEALEADAGGLSALDAEMGRLRQELGEAQERLDFVERMLAQGPDRHRLQPEDRAPPA
ncbi:MAG TPA: hypothetical protein VFY20_08005 [Gemmatimonadales bacterium]|nr:hypothetical protein [Gemmatimonadales bacterium]